MSSTLETPSRILIHVTHRYCQLTLLSPSHIAIQMICLAMMGAIYLPVIDLIISIKRENVKLT